MSKAKELIATLTLARHPEGGYYKQIYKSVDTVLSKRFDSEHSAGTSIYYLLEGNDYSAWHRLKSDEIWHFYSGTTLTLYIIDEKGELTSFKLGNPIENPEAAFQVTIKANQWFAAEVNDKSSYTLVGCTVTPGFEFQDFELGSRTTLIDQYPQFTSIINRLTREKPVLARPDNMEHETSHIRMRSKSTG